MFRDQTNVFEEYLYSIFYFQPNSKDQIQLILQDKLFEAYPECDFLLKVYPNYFEQLYQMINTYTNNISEYIYIFRFMYPQYVKKLY